MWYYMPVFSVCFLIVDQARIDKPSDMILLLRSLSPSRTLSKSVSMFVASYINASRPSQQLLMREVEGDDMSCKPESRVEQKGLDDSQQEAELEVHVVAAPLSVSSSSSSSSSGQRSRASVSPLAINDNNEVVSHPSSSLHAGDIDEAPIQGKIFFHLG